MAANIASHTRITPTTAFELVDLWILTRQTTGVLTAEYIESAELGYTPGFTTDILDDCQPRSLRWVARTASHTQHVVDNFALGQSLLLANDTDVDAWIAERSTSILNTYEILNRMTGGGPRVGEAADQAAAERKLWAPRAAAYSAYLAAFTVAAEDS
jgi:hypothetical protein